MSTHQRVTAFIQSVQPAEVWEEFVLDNGLLEDAVSRCWRGVEGVFVAIAWDAHYVHTQLSPLASVVSAQAFTRPAAAPPGGAGVGPSVVGAKVGQRGGVAGGLGNQGSMRGVMH